MSDQPSRFQMTFRIPPACGNPKAARGADGYLVHPEIVRVKSDWDRHRDGGYTSIDLLRKAGYSLGAEIISKKP